MEWSDEKTGLEMEAVLQSLDLQPGERLWKLYVYRTAGGGQHGLEHHIYSKVKPDGRLAMITFAVDRPAGRAPTRSNLARVGDLDARSFEQIIDSIDRTGTAHSLECERCDVSAIASLADQRIELCKGWQR